MTWTLKCIHFIILQILQNLKVADGQGGEREVRGGEWEEEEVRPVSI